VCQYGMLGPPLLRQPSLTDSTGQSQGPGRHNGHSPFAPVANGANGANANKERELSRKAAPDLVPSLWAGLLSMDNAFFRMM